MFAPITRTVAAVAMVGTGLTACGSQHAAPPAASSSSATKASAAPSPIASSSTPSSTSAPDCVGLSICRPPPPDAEGNPACYYSDGWRGDSSGNGIEVWYFRDPKNPPNPDKVTALVRKKDGTNESQDADIGADQQVHRFGFPAIAESSVQEVLLTSGSGARCFVIGPGG
ncbi:MULTISPECIES: hypothetical protein [unclassified Mycobacterium]|uniref:hypothetical protein n=1 Tax=unclassified Mycobacterium TaxID=2642494 RepID=UPI0006DC22C1|nr:MULTISPECIES: hypothetical protein [unclassified Mycobacterium]OBG69108.1 hypothetical protein A5702_13240 [Mycobacterium sp. E3339]OBH83386.1 hypothetical protein A5680_11760 [Mycobacterium sp. E2989]